MVAIVGRVAESRILNGYILPQIPRFSAAFSDFGKVGRVSLIAVATRIGAAAVGDEYEIAFEQVYRAFFAVFNVFYLFGDFLFAVDFENDVLYVYATQILLAFIIISLLVR